MLTKEQYYKIAKKELEMSHGEPLDELEDRVLRHLIDTMDDRYKYWGLRQVYLDFVHWQFTLLNNLTKRKTTN